MTDRSSNTLNMLTIDNGPENETPILEKSNSSVTHAHVYTSHTPFCAGYHVAPFPGNENTPRTAIFIAPNGTILSRDSDEGWEKIPLAPHMLLPREHLYSMTPPQTPRL